MVMAFVWLMTLGIGFANACLLGEALGHHAPTAQVQATHHEDVDGQALESEKAVCLTVCEVEKTAVVKFKQANVPSDLQAAPVVHFPALTVTVLDLNDRSEPSVVPDWREPPVSIRFLRLTI
jgi:hypothetical protein